MFFPDPPSCGLGGSTTDSGPCTGTLFPKDAGGHVFDGLSASKVVPSLLAAGAIVAALIFAVFVARKVGRFFGKKAPLGMTESDDKFWANVGKTAGYVGPKVSGIAAGAPLQLEHADAEFGDHDTEDDMEDDTPFDDEPEMLALEGPADVMTKPGAELSDDEYDELEWRLERQRQEGGG